MLATRPVFFHKVEEDYLPLEFLTDRAMLFVSYSLA
jgi:hypothetical protein